MSSYPNALFPPRLTEEEIVANPEYTAYVILNIPTHGKNVPFDTIGRTTFKKFILKAYTDFYDNGSLKTSNFRSVPFVISKTRTIQRVVYKSETFPAPESSGNDTSIMGKKNKSLYQNINQNQRNFVHPTTSSSQASGHAQQTPFAQMQPKPEIQAANVVTPALTIEMDGSDGDYYAPSHCKWKTSGDFEI